MADTGEIATDPQSENYERCEQCGAPAERAQRYCVNCGAHRRHVPDPAAAYMSRATAPAGSSAASPTRTAPAGASGVPAHPIGLLGALAIALIPVAAAVGVLIGRSSNNQDAKVIQALHQQPTTTTLLTSGAVASGSAGASTVTSTSKTPTKAKQTKGRHAAAASTSTSTANGKATKITGSKVTATQQSKGSAEAKKIQNATGSNYVQSANNLPSSVVVGP
jgi:hypothetical protein